MATESLCVLGIGLSSMPKSVSLEDILQPWSGKERCGVWTRGSFYEMENLSASPDRNYQMSAKEIRNVVDLSGFPVLGIWHSHPDGKTAPSQTDIDFHPVGYHMAIVEGGFWRDFTPEGVLISEYPLSKEPLEALEALEKPLFGFAHTGDLLSSDETGCSVCGDGGARAMAFRLSDVCCGICEQVAAGELPPAAAAQARVQRARRAGRVGA